MRWTQRIIACLASLTASSAMAASVGFQTVSVPVPGDRPIQVGVWYPTDAPERSTPLGLERQSVAPGAPIAGAGHPLVVISHGTGSWFGQHYDTAHVLAQAGFVVAALSHTGDTYDDRSRSLRPTERSGELKRLVDFMTADWSGHAVVDPARIGAYGFSSGGFTVLSAIGGVPDMGKLTEHCRSHPHFYDCALTRQLGAHAPQSYAPVTYDPRIRAAVVAAPALGFAFAPDGLAGVKVPVQLWRAEWDTVLPQPHYAEAVRGALPRPPEYHVVAGADHFDFLPPCSPAMKAAAPDICAGTFDRAAFHADFNRRVLQFFRRTLR